MSPGSRATAGGQAGHQSAWTRLTGELPVPADPAERDDLLWQQLAAQLRWYDRAATRCRWSYQLLKVTTLLLGAVVTVLAAAGATAVLTAALAAAGVVAEGMQQVFQFHANWINYRETVETLRQHGLLYVAKLPPYTDPRTRRAVLAHNLQDATFRERGTWSSTIRQSLSGTSQDTGPMTSPTQEEAASR